MKRGNMMATIFKYNDGSEFYGVKLNPILLCLALVMGLFLQCSSTTEQDNPDLYARALENGRAAGEGYRRCRAYLEAWLEYADPVSGLIPENLNEGIDRWTPKNSAADNYPFMVLVAALTDSALFHGTMSAMLKSEIRRTSRIGHMPD